MAETNAALKLVAAFVTLILGVALITTVATQTESVSNPTDVLDESLNIATARLAANQINTTKTFTLANAGFAEFGGLVTNSVTFENASGFVIGANNYTVDYTADTIVFANTSFMVQAGGAGNITLATYQYYPSSYVGSQFGRSSIDLIAGFFAIALMAISVGLFLSIARDKGIIQ